MIKRSLQFGFVVVCLCLLLPGLNWLEAQTVTARLEGVVSDASGAVIPNVNVELVNEATNVRQTTVSDTRGWYYFPLLPPGHYKLTVAVTGFKTFERSGMVLEVQQSARVDVVLSPGDLSVKVEVTGEAPRLDAVDATMGRVVDNTSLLSMPLGSRSPLALAQLAPGITPVGGYKSGGGNAGLSANGGRLDQTDVLLDGVSLNVMEHNSGIQQLQIEPKVETIQEFKVQTDNFSAEYGNSGAAVISMVSRSGTNELRGSLFEFHQNNHLNANNFFSNRAGAGLPVWRYNQMGGAVGGPVYIPKVYDGRNKTFFFVHHERTAVPGSRLTERDTVPTEAQKAGDFSQTLASNGQVIQIFDPATAHKDVSGTWIRDAFPGNKIPSSRVNAVAAKVMSYYPAANQPGVVANFYADGNTKNTWYEQTIKIDHNFSERQRTYVRYTRDHSTDRSTKNLWGEGNIMVPNNFNQSDTTPWSAVADYTNVLSPTAVLNLRVGVTRTLSSYDTQSNTGSFLGSTLGFGQDIQAQQTPMFYLEDYGQTGPSIWNRQMRGSDISHFMASLSKVIGAHSIKIGGEARLARLNYGQPGIATASFNFCRQETMSHPLTGNSAEGNALASFMLGWGGACNMGNGAGQSYDLTSLAASRSYGGYIQDDFRLTNKLTLNLGLRYEVQLPATERHNRFTSFDLSAPSPLASAVKSAADCPACANLKGGYTFMNSDNRRAYDTDWNDFAPRFGFAYQFMPRMVVRGGYGIYFGLSSAGLTAELGDGFITSTPWKYSSDGGITQNATIVNPFPNGINQPVGSANGMMQGVGDVAYGPNRANNVTPLLQQWNLSVQRELGFNSVVEVAYSATKGTHLGFGTMRTIHSLFDANYLSMGDKLLDQVTNPFYGLVPATSTMATPTIQRRYLLTAYPQFSYYSERPGPAIANSIYHGLQLKFRKRLSHGLQSTVHYTFSKSISDSDSADDPNTDWLGGAIGINGSGRPRVQNWGNLRLERSPSTFDIPHRFVADFSYQLPIGRHQLLGADWNRALDLLAGGWQLNAIIIASSGVPLAPHLQGNGTIGGIGAAQRPNVIGDPCTSGSIESRLDGYLDANAFSRPASWVSGTAPRTMGYCRAPGFHGMDASVFKQFMLNEGRTRYVEIRAEAFNLTNTPIFAVPNTTWGASGFGLISSQSNGPRSVQLAAKLYF
ncbi:TonB-dependent receptor [uncultured Paludibaculum sp.]|uniref:TonB-dependent receptor n=1 Tax=uncultured Paludibaculum sp. TaxID=1765020 RepID=UPI002AAA630E|nr:TonB-dependent receptor [uncultured Paludibaculum sp.]